MSAQQPQKKRARGLAAASSSKSKKSKTEIDEEHGIENPSETWADLVELWENAFDGLSGEDPASAAPLFRGLIFECDRIVRNSVDPLHPLQTTASSADAPQEGSSQEGTGISLENFYLIYGTSVYGLGQLIYLSSELALSSEPSPDAFFSKSLDLLLVPSTSTSEPASDDEPPLISRLEASKKGDWKMELAKARSVVGYLGADSEGLEEDEFEPLLKWSTDVLSTTLDTIFALPAPPPPAEGEVPPPAARDPATTFFPSPPTDAQSLSLFSATVVAVAGLVETVPPSVVDDCSNWCSTQFDKLNALVDALPAGTDEEKTEKNDWTYKLRLASGKLSLALASVILDSSDGEEMAIGEPHFVDIERAVESARADFGQARRLRPRKTPASAPPVESAVEGMEEEEDEDEDELSALIIEASLLLVGIYESLEESAKFAAKIEQLEASARAEGWAGYGSEGEDDDEDDDEDEE